MVSSGAEIQVNHGEYTRIHNAILERLAEYDFTSREYACILFLLRKTYGFNRKECKLSYGDFRDATGIDPAHVSRTMKRLVEYKVVTRSEARTKTAATWSFNKYFEQWTIKSRLKTPSHDDTNYCSFGNSLEDEPEQTIAETAIELLPNEQKTIAETAIDDCQKSNSYISAKDTIKDISKDTPKESEDAPPLNRNGYFGMPYPHRKEKDTADGYTQQAKKLGVDAPAFVAIVDVLIDTALWRSLIEKVGETKWLDFAKQDAIRLIRLGNTTPEHITRLIDMYKTVNHWRGDAPILPRQLTEFAGQVKDGLTVQERKERNGDNRKPSSNGSNGYVSEAEAGYVLPEQYR